MSSIRLTPISILSVATLIGFGTLLIITLVAVERPWLGLTFSVGDQGQILVRTSQGPAIDIIPGTVMKSLSSGADTVELMASDLTAEPDGAMGTYAAYEAFLTRQGRLASLMNGNPVLLTDNDGRNYAVGPAPIRPISTLPVEYWVQVIVGLVAWLISSSVFAFRTGESSARYLLLSGASTLLFASFAAVYSTRELALPADLFRFLNDGNFLGGSLFAAVFVALLLTYPRRICPPWVGIGILALFIAWFVMQQVGVFESMTFARRFLVLVGVGTTFILAGVHWYLTRRRPAERAVLKWFLLSWMLGTTLFCVFILVPQLFDIDTSAVQGYGFSLFLLVYAGLAFGILRFKLFELGEWWARIVVWTGTVLCLLFLDLLFLLVLRLSSGVSLSLALVLSGLLWIPLRAFVWSRLLRSRAMDRGALFEQVVDVALTLPQDRMQSRWEALIRDVFDPLDLHPVEEKQEPALLRDGLELRVPAVASMPGLKLEYARGGRQLFDTRDLTLVEELVAMLLHTIASGTAHEKGVSEERQRIARDIHDNIGSQLLSALHSHDVDRKDDMIRETLSDLRDIINNAAHPGLTFEETLADLRAETDERLAAENIRLNWTLKTDQPPGMTPQAAHAIRSIIREAVSNVIRHAQATVVDVEIGWDRENMSLVVNDNGRGIDLDTLSPGNGLTNLSTRMTALGGSLGYVDNGPGMAITARFPINQTGLVQ